MLLKVIRMRETSPPMYVGTSFLSPQQLHEGFRERMEALDREEFWVVCLDARNRYQGHNVVSVGHLSGSIVHPREVFKPAVLSNSGAIVLMHNHLSGDPRPSEEDVAVTRRLMGASDVMGISILDHIVFGDKTYVSFKEEGLL